MAKKSTQNTSTNQTQNVVTTPTNPAWVDSGLADMGKMFSNLAGMDPRSFVAGPDPLQTQAAGAAANLGRFGAPPMNGAHAGQAGYDPTGGQRQAPGLPPPGQGFGPSGHSYDPNMQAAYDSMGGGMGAAYKSAYGPGATNTVGPLMGGNGPDPGLTNPNARDPFAGYNNSGGGVSDPYGSAMSTFDRMQSSGPNTYNPAMSGAAGYNATTGQATTYNPTTGQATNYGVQTGNASHYDPTSYGATTGSASLTGDSPQVQSQSLLDNLGAYMSPYTNDVVNTTLAGFDQNAGYSRAQDALARAGDSTFGGSGGSIQTALNEQNIRQNRAQIEAQLRDQGFQTGAGLSGQDADRRQSASSQNSAQGLQRALADMSAKNTFGLHNMDALNTASRDNANAANVAGQYNAGNDQDMSLANLGFQNTANRDNANASNTFGLANMDAANTASRDNAAANNSFGLANMDALNSAGATNAGFRQQTNLANQGAYNNAGQFNAGQRDIAANRQMEGARGLVGTANDQQGQQRANIDTQSQLGQILQQLQQAQAGAPLNLASALSQLWGGLPLDLLHGGTANSTSSGTSNTKGTQIGGDAKFGWDAQKGFSFGFGG